MINVGLIKTLKLTKRQVGSLRIFWKIIVDTQHGQIRVGKELSLWLKKYGAWHRLAWRRIPLAYDIIDKQNEVSYCQNESLRVDDDCIRFDGGFLKVLDSGLKKDVGDWGLEFKDVIAASDAIKELIVSIENGTFDNGQFRGSYYVGENVRLEADIAAYYEEGKDHPIFYYPHVKDDKGTSASVYLHEITVSPTKRTAHFDLSGKFLGTKEFSLAGPHLLVAAQDYERTNSDISYFEFLVDAIQLTDGTHGLGREPRTKSEIDKAKKSLAYEHLFGTDRNIFYVGHNPDIGENLAGLVRRIVFDPNSSCVSCA